ncbi:MAG: aminotransferase class I/II-fold pyridoxal phosphate-dependent enzyme [Chlorobi bacterium]|nr:aminotransferase class I/II-fold pyridoxal phosphate-dependent enzyme [Chlorobiota bacterium]
MIDLRSDTVTKPTPGMRHAMAIAKVGDDVFGEDPTTNELEEKVAAILGKEAALFVPSGTMGNQIALAVQAGAGDEVIVDSESHILHYETGAASVISRVQLRAVELFWSGDDVERLTQTMRPAAYYYPRTKGVCIENTHNRYSGAIMQLERICAIARWCNEHGLFLHCDGARLWNASVATGIAPSEFVSPCTTVMVCLSKGLGAPIGSVLAGPREIISAARRWRKILGGGMRQTGVIAAAGLYALEHHLQRLAEDHEHARLFANGISNHFELMLNPPPTNIVLFRSRLGIPAELILKEAARRGVLLSPGPTGWIRAVFHLDVDSNDTSQASQLLLQLHEELTGRSTIVM